MLRGHSYLAILPIQQRLHFYGESGFGLSSEYEEGAQSRYVEWSRFDPCYDSLPKSACRSTFPYRRYGWFRNRRICWFYYTTSTQEKGERP